MPRVYDVRYIIDIYAFKLMKEYKSLYRKVMCMSCHVMSPLSSLHWEMKAISILQVRPVMATKKRVVLGYSLASGALVMVGILF